MKLRSFRTLRNRIYRVDVRAEDWSQSDLQLMSQFGEPEIDLGGEFTTDPDVGEPVTFELPTQLVRLYSDTVKFSIEFDLRDHADAEDRALAWHAAIVTRIEAAVATLRGNVTSFTAETVTNLSVNPFNAEELKQV